MTEEELIDELTQDYVSLCHAMQTGVKLEMSFNPKPTDPKHLRVGVNSAMVEHAALVALLLKKGIITKLEYHTALRDGMREEVERYEQHLQNRFGPSVKLA